MKNYTITVNGNVYDVTVEEKAAGAAPVAVPAAAIPVPAAAPAQSGSAGSVKVEAGASGKVFVVEAKVGEQLNKGDTVIVLEAMKMEIAVVAPEAGTVASIEVSVGDQIDAGAVIATLN